MYQFIDHNGTKLEIVENGSGTLAVTIDPEPATNGDRAINAFLPYGSEVARSALAILGTPSNLAVVDAQVVRDQVDPAVLIEGARENLATALMEPTPLPGPPEERYEDVLHERNRLRDVLASIRQASGGAINDGNHGAH